MGPFHVISRGNRPPPPPPPFAHTTTTTTTTHILYTHQKVCLFLYTLTGNHGGNLLRSIIVYNPTDAQRESESWGNIIGIYTPRNMGLSNYSFVFSIDFIIFFCLVCVCVCVCLVLISRVYVRIHRGVLCISMPGECVCVFVFIFLMYLCVWCQCMDMCVFECVHL